MDTTIITYNGNYTKFECVRSIEFISIDNGPVIRIANRKESDATPPLINYGDRLVSATDIFIENSQPWQYRSYGDLGDTVYIYPRHEKTVQVAIINRIANRDNTRFRRLISYDHHIPATHTLKTVVIKPANGARGIGQIVIDTRKVNLHRFLKGLQQYPEQTLGEYKDRITYASVNERESKEGLNQLRRIAITEYIPNIVEEYRCITGFNGEICYIQKRDRRSVAPDFYQAIGSCYGHEILSPEELAQKITPLGFKALCEQFVDHIGPLYSFDLWIDKTGQWGIFEFSNEYGTEGIPDDIYRDFTMKCVIEYVSKHRGLGHIKQLRHGCDGVTYAYTTDGEVTPPVEAYEVKYKRDTRFVSTDLTPTTKHEQRFEDVKVESISVKEGEILISKER